MSNIVYIVCRASHRHASGAEHVLEQWRRNGQVWREVRSQVTYPTPPHASRGATLIGDDVVFRYADAFVAGVINRMTPHAGEHRLTYLYECEECPTPRGASVKVTYEKLAPILDKVLETGGNEIEVGALQTILTT